MIFLCVNMTPLDLPVVPLLNGIVMVESELKSAGSSKVDLLNKVKESDTNLDNSRTPSGLLAVVPTGAVSSTMIGIFLEILRTLSMQQE